VNQQAAGEDQGGEGSENRSRSRSECSAGGQNREKVVFHAC